MHSVESTARAHLPDAPVPSPRGFRRDGSRPDSISPRFGRGARFLAVLALLALPATAEETCTATAADTDALIDAINTANSAACDEYVIQLSENATYTLTDGYQGGNTGLPNIDAAITIEGYDSTIERQSDSDPFRFFRVAGGASLTLRQITLDGGYVENTVGGAIYVSNDAKLSVEQCTFRNNQAIEGGSGAIDVAEGATLRAQQCTFQNNRASIGGAIEALRATLVDIEQCTFQNNSADGSGGGAIYVDGTGTQDVSIKNSTFSQNTADDGGYGGAISLYAVSDAAIIQSTFVGNSAGRQGGAIWLNDATATIEQSIFDGSGSNDNCATDSGGSYTSSYNVSSDGSCADDCVSDKQGQPTCQTDVQDVLLSEDLGSNGGYTQTYSVMLGCLVTDQGGNESCSSDCSGGGRSCSPTLGKIPGELCSTNVDQRGVERPQGPFGRCDVGSYEAINEKGTVTPGSDGATLTIDIQIDYANKAVVNDSSTETDTVTVNTTAAAWQLTAALGSTRSEDLTLAISGISFLTGYQGAITDAPCYLCSTGQCPGSWDWRTLTYTLTFDPATGTGSCDWPETTTFLYYQIEFTNPSVGTSAAWDPRLRVVPPDASPRPRPLAASQASGSRP